MEYTTDKEVWFVTGTFRGPSSSLAPDDPQPRVPQGHVGGLKVSEWTSDELEKSLVNCFGEWGRLVGPRL
jgi:hypothetical protein